MAKSCLAGSSRARTLTTSSMSHSDDVLPSCADRISEMVLNQEIVRMGGRGYGDGLNAGMVIGLPPVMNFGQEPLRTKVLDEVFSGQKACTTSQKSIPVA